MLLARLSPVTQIYWRKESIIDANILTFYSLRTRNRRGSWNKMTALTYMNTTYCGLNVSGFCLSEISVVFHVKVQTGAQRKVKMEAVATCVYLHHKSTNTPLSTHVCVLRDRSWLLTDCGAGQVSQSTTVVKWINRFLYKEMYWSMLTHTPRAWILNLKSQVLLHPQIRF